MRVDIPQGFLDKLNDHIAGYDKWGLTNNCSSMATKGWNLVCSTKLSAGIPNTPANLIASMKKTGNHSTNVAIPYYIGTYKANGTAAPKRTDYPF